MIRGAALSRSKCFNEGDWLKTEDGEMIDREGGKANSSLDRYIRPSL